MTEPTGVTLAARSLVERFGFDKGRLLDTTLAALGYRPDDRVPLPRGGGTAAFSHLVLRECVVRYLTPALRGVGLRDTLDLGPNPVRLGRELHGEAARRAKASLDAATVVLSAEDVGKVAGDVARKHGVGRVADL